MRQTQSQGFWAEGEGICHRQGRFDSNETISLGGDCGEDGHAEALGGLVLLQTLVNRLAVSGVVVRDEAVGGVHRDR
jgi:hypothetical protein